MAYQLKTRMAKQRIVVLYYHLLLNKSISQEALCGPDNSDKLVMFIKHVSRLNVVKGMLILFVNK